MMLWKCTDLLVVHSMCICMNFHDLSNMLLPVQHACSASKPSNQTRPWIFRVCHIWEIVDLCKIPAEVTFFFVASKRKRCTSEWFVFWSQSQVRKSWRFVYSPSGFAVFSQFRRTLRAHFQNRHSCIQKSFVCRLSILGLDAKTLHRRMVRVLESVAWSGNVIFRIQSERICYFYLISSNASSVFSESSLLPAEQFGL